MCNREIIAPTAVIKWQFFFIFWVQTKWPFYAPILDSFTSFSTIRNNIRSVHLNCLSATLMSYNNNNKLFAVTHLTLWTQLRLFSLLSFIIHAAHKQAHTHMHTHIHLRKRKEKPSWGLCSKSKSRSAKTKFFLNTGKKLRHNFLKLKLNFHWGTIQ